MSNQKWCCRYTTYDCGYKEQISPQLHITIRFHIPKDVCGRSRKPIRIARRTRKRILCVDPLRYEIDVLEQKLQRKKGISIVLISSPYSQRRRRCSKRPKGKSQAASIGRVSAKLVLAKHQILLALVSKVVTRVLSTYWHQEDLTTPHLQQNSGYSCPRCCYS